MKGYFSHIVNRNQSTEGHGLRPAPSRNPFALRERLAEPLQESPFMPSTHLPLRNEAVSRTPSDREPSLVSPKAFPPRPEAPLFWPPAPVPGEKEVPNSQGEIRVPHVSGKEKPGLEPQKPEESTFPEKQKTTLEVRDKKESTHFPLRESVGSEPAKPQEEVLPVRKERVISFRYQMEKTGTPQDLSDRLKEQPPTDKVIEKREKEVERQAVLPQFQPQHQAEPSAPAQRRSLQPAQQAASPVPRTQPRREQGAPKLVIGKLTVEVIQTPPPAVQAALRPPRQKAAAPPASQTSQSPRYKLKFGLGQL